MKVYLDNAATTKIDPKVLAEMLPYLRDDFGNASSIYNFGQKARIAIEKARKIVVGFLNCSDMEVIFTGSATESDNMAILGVEETAIRLGNKKPHIITSAIEHPAVLETIKHLEKTGKIEATFLPVYKEGVVRVGDVKKAVKPNTALVSIMYANNEIGTIQPIAEIGKVLPARVIFHTDAAQAANYLDGNVKKLGVDLLTLSGHKIYGPKGVGVLYVKKDLAINPIMFGGHQEMGFRPGTENVAGIVGLGKAVELIAKNKPQTAKIKKLRDKFVRGVLKGIAGVKINGSLTARLSNNVNFSFRGVEGEAVVMALDQKDIAVSTGSACSSGSLEPSHTLLALGMGKEQAHSSVRFTLGKYNTEAEINYTLKVLPEIIKKLRKISGN